MIIVPQQILEYTNINIKTRHPNWSASTTYQFSQAEDDINTVFYDHYYFRSVIDNNIGNIPTEHPDKWLRWDISNRYAQVDLRATTETTWNYTTAVNPSDNALITEFDNNVYDAISFGNIHGENIKVEQFDAQGNIINTQTKVIYTRPTSNNWYAYFFEDFINNSTRDSFFFRLQPVSGGRIKVTVIKNSSTGVASVGYMVAGVSKYAGCSLYGASLGLDDNSLIEIDDFGITTVTKRIASEYMDIDVIFPKEQIMDKMRQAREVFGDIVLFIGDETDNSDYEHLFLLGYVEGFNTILTTDELISASWTLKEII